MAISGRPSTATTAMRVLMRGSVLLKIAACSFVGSVVLRVARAGTGDAPVILHADEKCAALAIGETNDIFVKCTVIESLALFAFEFDGELLASGDQGFNFGFRHGGASEALTRPRSLLFRE